MGDQIKWERKASQQEVLMGKLNDLGSRLVVYRISFCARRPVQPREVEQALCYLYRKSPNLRVYLTESGGEMCFREMDEERIDFEVSTADVDEVTDFLHTHPYPKDSPLWRARLVPAPTPSYHPQRLSSFHDDLQDAFPHCYHLLFGFSHTIGDGYTYDRICAAFSHILDCVLSGKEVDGEQIGCFDLNEDYDNKAQECLARFFTDEAWREECIREVNDGKPESLLLLHVLTPSVDRSKKTLLYTQTLDKTTTTRLLEKCRAAKVTLSSCMAAAGNLALVDMLVEKGVVQDTYSISNVHLINMRRTWPKGTAEHVFGSYTAMSLRQFIATPRAADDDQFWEYARGVHRRFYDLLLDDQFMQKAKFSSWCFAANTMQYVQYDLTLNNRGDLTHMFEGTKEVTVTKLLSSTSIHNAQTPWGIIFGTIRGHLSHTMRYNSGLVSEVTAVRYSDLVHARLLKAAGS